MQQQFRMRKNGQFRFVYRKGRQASGNLLRLHFVAARKLQGGFAVSRQVGGAVVRNRVKRRMRECFRLLVPSLAPGYYVFTANVPAAEADYHALCEQMRRLLLKLGLLRNRG